MISASFAKVDQIRMDRERREREAARIAADIPPGDYSASGNDVIEHGTRAIIATAASHWDAVLILLAISKK